MTDNGIFNKNFTLGHSGLKGYAAAWYNLGESELVEQSLVRCEARLTAKGALVALTGQHTGRSAKDKFVVRDENTISTVWWDNNKPMERAAFDRLHADFLDHIKGRDLFVQDLIGGADEKHALKTRVITEQAWHSLFIRNLLIRPERAFVEDFVPQFTIIDMPSFKADPQRHGCRTETVIAVDLTRMIVLIGGTSYAGEIKKSVFTALNYILPAKGVMPMHCSANAGKAGDTAVFFGLSGTGKTTLSADPARTLIGDDEHGWGPEGVFNFEGGCYAKTIRLSEEAEPEIYATTQRFGTVLENVVLDENRNPDFNDGSLTENTRCAYPLHFIPNASATGRAWHPKNIIMLTADAFGILPPVARLTPAQAMYHFLSGYTAKVAGTEKGVTEPEATFSTCFGAPFMPRHPSEYGNLLRDLIAKHKVDCWLVNTGWTGGAYGTGKRMPIKATRTLLSAALDGSLKTASFRTDPNFGFEVPVSVEGVDSAILDPRSTWADRAAYDRQAKRLTQMFVDNFAKFETHVDASVMGAAPRWLKRPNKRAGAVFPERVNPMKLRWPIPPAGLFFCHDPVQSFGMTSEPIFAGRGILITEDMVDERFTRAQGPGGQNVNKVSTAVELRLVLARANLPESVQDRMIALAGQKATKDGEIIIFADKFRTQDRNRQDARERLAELVAKAAEPPPPPRRKTKPSKGAVERRLKEKTGRGTIKKNRGRVSDE